MTSQVSEISSDPLDAFAFALAVMDWVAKFLSVTIATKSALTMVCAIAVLVLDQSCFPRYLALRVMEVQEF